MRFPRSRITVGRLMMAIVLMTPGLLLLRAVMATREAVNRSVCISNLKQLVVALHDYETAYGSFPPGTIPNPALSPERRLSWVLPIRQFLGGSSILTIDPTVAWDAPPNWPLRLVAAPGVTYVGTTPADEDRGLTCPDDPAFDGPARPRPLAYVGVAGVGADAPDLPAGHKRAGVFGSDRTTRLADIADGPAQTMILVETARAQAAWSAGGPSSVRGVDPAARPHMGPGRPFGGYHPGGANAAMADGSVRFVRESVAPKVFEAMATIAGGESVPAGWDRP